MGHIVLVTCSLGSRHTIHKLLTSQIHIISLSFKQLNNGELGDLVLAEVGTEIGDVFLFDLKENPKLMHEGHLWRLLETTEITKVMHDCRHHSMALKQQFGVTLKNVFDTQAADCLRMMQKQLPPRLISLPHLYQKYGDASQHLLPRLQASLKDKTGHFWSQRPMSRETIKEAATNAQMLLPVVYENVKRALEEDSISINLVEELSYGYIHGKFRNEKKKNKASSSSSSHVSTKLTIIKLADCQKFFQKHTVSQAAV